MSSTHPIAASALAAGALALLAGCAAPVTQQEGAPGTPNVVRPSRPPPVHAADLLTSAPATGVEMLGAPSLRRSEGSAEVWLYTAADGCRLDLVLFREADGLKVAHAVAHPVASGSETACLSRIAAGT